MPRRLREERVARVEPFLRCALAVGIRARDLRSAVRRDGDQRLSPRKYGVAQKAGGLILQRSPAAKWARSFQQRQSPFGGNTPVHCTEVSNIPSPTHTGVPPAPND